MNLNGNPLKDLRDIHLPPPVSHWPPAPGWIFLSVLLLLLTAFYTYRFIQYWKKTRAKRIALKTLTTLEKRYQQRESLEDIATELSILIRRTALAYFPRKHVAGLEGARWLEFLDKSGQTDQFTRGPGRLLTTAPYQKRIHKEFNALFSIVKHWIHKSV